MAESRSKARCAGEHLVEHRAESEDVGAVRRPRVGADLLGRHVADGAHHDARVRRRPTVATALSSAEREIAGDLGEAEIENLDAAVRGDEDVLGLQVAVDDALCRGRRRGRARSESRSRAPFGGAIEPTRSRSRRVSPSRSSVTTKVSAVVMADVVDGEDVRMVEGAGGAGFLLEAGEPFVGVGERSGKDLDGDVATEPLVAGAIDLAHAAGAELAEDFVWADASACLKCHGSPNRARSGEQDALDGTKTWQSWK